MDDPTNLMIPQKRLGIPGYLFTIPLTARLQGINDFVVSVDAPARNAVRLREHDLDAALLTPIDYARDGSEYQVVPAVAVSSQSSNGAITLHFREGLHNLSTLAVDPSSSSEIILAKIILAEEFDVSPRIVPISGPLDTMLGRADAALLVGDSALRETAVHENAMDLVEAWSDLTELPYVHAFWCTRDNGLTEPQIHTLQHARDEGLSMIGEIANRAASPALGAIPPHTIQDYLESFSFDFSEEAEEGLKEFLRYAYYHGVLPDVPDIRYFGAADDN